MPKRLAGQHGGVDFAFDRPRARLARLLGRRDVPRGPSRSSRWAHDESTSPRATAWRTNGAIVVQVRGDTTREADETFTVSLPSPSNATLAESQAVSTIMNDD